MDGTWPLDLTGLERPMTPLLTAGKAFGMGRTKTYELHQRGEFPVPVLRIGGRYVVQTAELLRALGITPGHRTNAAA